MIINEIIKNYKLTGQTKVKIQGQAELYERLFNGFDEQEKIQIIQDYICYKSNKVYPSIMDLKKFITGYKNNSYVEEPKEQLPPPNCTFKKPELRELFIEVVKLAHIEGIAFSPYAESLGLKFGNKLKVENGRFVNKIYRWEEIINEAKETNKEYFKLFQNLDFIEEATLTKYCGFDLV